jgi:hypothetical protein
LGVHLEGAAEHHADVRTLDLREPRQLERHLVAPGVQIRREILPVGVRYEGAGLARGKIRDQDVDARHGRALFVRHFPLQSTEPLLSADKARDGQQEREQKRSEACVHDFSPRKND